MQYPPKAPKTAEWEPAAWRAAAERIDDPCFGLQAAEVWRPTDFRALGYAFLASRTLRTALELGLEPGDQVIDHPSEQVADGVSVRAR